MAKKSSIERNLKRQKLVAKYAAKKEELKKILKNPNTTDEVRVVAHNFPRIGTRRQAARRHKIIMVMRKAK